MDGVILDDVKKLLGIPKEVTEFDTDVLIHINSVLSVLEQLGVDRVSVDAATSWSKYIPSDMNLEDIKTYVYLKVRLIFDPPTSSSGMQAVKDLASEFEWRIFAEADCKKEVDIDE